MLRSINQGWAFRVSRVGRHLGSHPISGGFFGGQLGSNWQAGWAVFGIQGDAHWADIDGRGSCFDTGFSAVVLAAMTRSRSFGAVTGRVGAAIDRALIYAKGGWAWEESEPHRDAFGRSRVSSAQAAA